MRRQRGRAPIPRIGVEEALKLIREQKYKLQGRELVSPIVPAQGLYKSRWVTTEGGNAEYHLTTDGAAKVRAVLEKPT